MWSWPNDKNYFELGCKLWKKCGGDIWLDLDTNLNHTGNMDFRGCLMLSVNQVDNLNADIKYAEGSMRT